MNTTQLTVNRDNLVKNLRFSFTQATTVLGEMMQNSRRAGATSVSFDYVEATRCDGVVQTTCEAVRVRHDLVAIWVDRVE